MIEEKVTKIANKYGLDSTNRYLKEALFVIKYEDKLQPGSDNNMQSIKSDNPNQALAIIGDRFLKLVLSIESYSNNETPEEISKFTNEHEKNVYLANLKIVEQSDGYAEKNGELIENTKSDITSIATMVEAIIGALYLDEYQKSGTTKIALEFIKNHIMK